MINLLLVAFSVQIFNIFFWLKSVSIFLVRPSSLLSASNKMNSCGPLIPGLKWLIKDPSVLSFNKRPVLHASISSGNGGLEFHQQQNSSVPVTICHGVEPFRGKSGSVSFHGLTYQLVEERKLVSAPFQEEKGSFFWVLAPIAFISSLILPQFFIGNVIEAFLKNEILVGIYRTLYLFLHCCHFNPSVCHGCNCASIVTPLYFVYHMIHW